MVRSNERVFKALARQGLLASKEGPVYSVRLTEASHAPEAEILLPEGFALESKAVAQLASFASVRHPAGGEVRAAFATPDFHPGATVPVGSVVAISNDLVIPQAIGTDIQCGMRLHVTDLSVDQFMSGKAKFIELLKGDLLLGTRNLPMHVVAMQSIFNGGCMNWLEAVRPNPLGRLVNSDMSQLERDLDHVYGMGSFDGDAKWAPSTMVPDNRDVVRDPSLATVGGGNHFVEIQVVEEVIDRARGFEWGVKNGRIAFMIHSGSPLVSSLFGSV